MLFSFSLGGDKFHLKGFILGMLLRTAKGIFWAVTLVGTLIFANAIQASSILVRPFSYLSFHAINRFCANSWWGFLTWTCERIWHVHPVFSGDDVPPLENALVFANHQEMPDIIVLMMLAIRKGRLGDLKWFLKRELRWVPGVGWGATFLDCLFVKRHWESDRANIEATFARYHRYRFPFWVMTFPEATRLTPRKLAVSQKYSQKRGLPVLAHTLLPRTKGFNATVVGLRERLDAVYDVTIAYPGGRAPTLWDFCTGRCSQVGIHVRRFPIAAMPTEDTAMSAWLLDRFVEKDRRLAALTPT